MGALKTERDPLAIPVKDARPQYYLRQGSAYLHQSAEALTGDRNYAWKGDADQALACCNKFPLAKHMTMEIII